MLVEKSLNSEMTWFDSIGYHSWYSWYAWFMFMLWLIHVDTEFYVLGIYQCVIFDI